MQRVLSRKGTQFPELGGVEDGPLFDGSFCNSKELEGLKLAHTNVKHKPPKPEFTKPFDVPVWQVDDD